MMRQYRVKSAVAGQIQVNVISAESRADAARQTISAGADVLKIEALNLPTFHFSAGQRFDLTLFSQELCGLLDAGLSLIESLEALTEKIPPGQRRAIVQSLVKALYEGQSLSGAMKRHPGVFPELYIAGIQSAEQTSGLSTALARYIAYQRQADALRKRLIAASIYPAIVLAAGMAVSLFLLVYLVPKFAHVYEDMPRELPLLSRWLLQWGGFVTRHLSALLTFLGAAALLQVWIIVNREARQRMLGAVLQLGALKRQWHMVQLTRLYRSLGMLLQGGISVLHAMRLCGDVLSPALRPNLERAIEAVNSGLSLSHAFSEQGLAPPVALRMLRVGERSGQLGDMLMRIAQLQDEDIERWSDLVARVFPPLLLMAIAIFVGGIVVLMYLPIFDLAGSLQ